MSSGKPDSAPAVVVPTTDIAPAQSPEPPVLMVVRKGRGEFLLGTNEGVALSCSRLILSLWLTGELLPTYRWRLFTRPCKQAASSMLYAPIVIGRGCWTLPASQRPPAKETSSVLCRLRIEAWQSDCQWKSEGRLTVVLLDRFVTFQQRYRSSRGGSMIVGSFQTVRSAIEANCVADALCHDCGALSRLDLGRWSADGHGETVLAKLPLTCRCGSKQHRILVADTPEINRDSPSS
jgi:hypothetical protein